MHKILLNLKVLVSIPLGIRSIGIRLHLRHNFLQRSSFLGFSGLDKILKPTSPVSSESLKVRKGLKSLNPLGVQLRSIGVNECMTRPEMIKMNSPAFNRHL